MENIIEVHELKKTYGNFEAVKGISFHVKKGSMFSFLGTNGAGKSSTIDILCTLNDKTSGNVTINGHTLGTRTGNNQIRQSIGVVFQKSLLDDRLTVYENIIHRGKTYGLSATLLKENYAFVSHYLHLEDIAHKKYGKLSGGQKRRADIARALIHKPAILFLDEPTTGLDPQTRVFVWEAIKQLQQDTGMTIFLTTHYMEEATVTDEIVIIKEGRIVAQGSPSALKEQYAYDQLIISSTNLAPITRIFNQQNISYHLKSNELLVPIQSTLQGLALLKQVEPYVQSFEVLKGSMDSVFIHINEGMEVK